MATNSFQIKRSSVPGKVPLETDLLIGELAVNLYDGIIFSKNTAGNVIVIGASTTSNITEGTNLYFTDARVATAVSNQTLSNATFSSNVSANYFIGNGSLLTGLAPASQDYVFTGANSSISGYFIAKNLAAYDESNVYTVTKTVNTSPTLLATFATETGFPNITVIPSGRLSVRLETQKAVGAAGYFVFAEIYKRTTSNVETLLATTDNSTTSIVNSTIQQEVSAFISSPINSINVTDIFIVKLYAQMLTSSASISLRFDDLTNSGVTIPTLPASAVNFVPYNNATSNINLGNYGITASFLNATTLTGNINVSNITNLTTNSVIEGNNLYFTNTRAISALTEGSGINIDANGRITATATTDLENVTSNIIPSTNSTYNLGSADKRWKTLFLANNTLDLGGAIISSDGSGSITISSTGAVLPLNSKVQVGGLQETIALVGNNRAVATIVPIYTQTTGLNTPAANLIFGANPDSYVFTNFTFNNGTSLQQSQPAQFYF